MFVAVSQFLSTNWRNILMFMLVGALSAVGLHQAFDIFNQPPEKEINIAEEWNRSILKLGVVPVFPPEEDIYVGDIFAVIKFDRRTRNSIDSEAFLNRSIKIYSSDMRDVLQDKYNRMPLFSETIGSKDSTKGYWAHAASADEVFKSSGGRKYLAIAAFPSFTIKRAKSIAGGAGAFGALLGRSQNEDDTIEVKILGGETYGIPSIDAEEQFERICQFHLKAVCSDEGLRRQLSHIAPDLNVKNIGPDMALFPYAIDVELVFVNRVYLARSISQKSLRGRSSSGLFSVSAPRTESAGTSGDHNLVPGAAGQDDVGSAPPRAASGKQAVPVAKDQASASATNDTNSGIALETAFQRPVVIGYRAVRKRFDPAQGTVSTVPPLGDWAQ